MRLMEFTDTHYAIAPEGVYIAYQVLGDGPIDVVWQSDWPGNSDVEMEEPLGALWTREVASFARVIFHDRRGIGLSSRNVALPNLETRVSDLLTVMDAVGSERPILTGVFESGAPNALLAATKPDRVHSMVWAEPNPRFAAAPDYPWGRTPSELDAELRDIEQLWGTLAYGRSMIQRRPLGGTCCRRLMSPSWRRRAATPAHQTSRGLSRRSGTSPTSERSFLLCRSRRRS